jgi:hypothetical protein
LQVPRKVKVKVKLAPVFENLALKTHRGHGGKIRIVNLGTATAFLIRHKGTNFPLMFYHNGQLLNINLLRWPCPLS